MGESRHVYVCDDNAMKWLRVAKDLLPNLQITNLALVEEFL